MPAFRIEIITAGGARARAEAEKTATTYKGVAASIEETNAATAAGVAPVRSYGAAQGEGAAAAEKNAAKVESSGKAAAVAGAGFGHAAKSVGGLVAAYAGYEAVKGAIEYTDELVHSTQVLTSVTGLDARQASRWLELAKQRGLQASKVGIAFSTLSKQIRGAETGSSTAAKGFHALGIPLHELEHLSTEQVLLRIADGLSHTDNAAKKAALTQQFFGKSGREFLPILEQGGKALDRQLGKFEGLSEEQQKSGEEAIEFGRKVSRTYDEVRLKVTFAMLEAGKATAGWVKETIAGKGTVGEWGAKAVSVFGEVEAGEGKVGQSLHEWGEDAVQAGVAIEHAGATAGKFIDSVMHGGGGGAGSAIRTVAKDYEDVVVWAGKAWLTAAKFELAVAGGAIKAAPGVVSGVAHAFQDAGAWVGRAVHNVEGFVSSLIPVKVGIAAAKVAIVPFVAALLATVKAAEIFSPALGGAAQIARTVFTAGFHVAGAAIHTFLDLTGNVATVLGDVVGVASNLLRGKWGNAWKDAKHTVVDAWHTVTGLTTDSWHTMKSMFTNGLHVITGVWAAGWGTIKKVGGNAADAVKGIFTGIWGSIEGAFTGGVNKVIDVLDTMIGLVDKLPFIDIPKIGHVGGSAPNAGKDVNGKSLGRARGGGVAIAARGISQVPGVGNQDTVPLYANGAMAAVVAPGEDVMVATRHQRAALDYAVAKTYGVDGMPGFYKANRRPHHAATGALFEGVPHAALGLPSVSVPNPVDVAGEAASAVGHAARSLAGTAAGAVISKLPNPSDVLPGWLGGFGNWLKGQLVKWVEGKALANQRQAQLSGGQTASATAYAEYMLNAGFPSVAKVIAEGLGTIKSESGFRKNNAQGPSGHIGPWAESPAFGSTKVREDPEGSTFAAYRVGWSPTRSFWPAWGRWEAEQSGLAGGGAGSYGPEFMGIASQAISKRRKPGRVKHHAAGGFPLQGAPTALKRTDSGHGPADAKHVVEWATNHLGSGDQWGYAGEWCGAFLGADMLAHGIEPPSGYPAAAAWGSWGKSDSGPHYGDVVVIGGSGHVGISMGGNEMVSGNFSNSVAKSTIGEAAGGRPITGYRIPPYQGGAAAGAGGTKTKPSLPASAGAHVKGGVTGQGGGTTAPAHLKVSTAEITISSGLPDNLHQVRKELRERRQQLGEYRIAYHQAKRVDVKAALHKNVVVLQNRIEALRKQQARLVKERHDARRAAKIKARGNFPDLEQQIGSDETAYNKANEYAAQVVELEPETLGGYAATESAAFGGELSAELTWRNHLVKGIGHANDMAGKWESEAAAIEALRKDHPRAYQKRKYRIKPLREAAANARSSAGEWSGKLTDVQGANGPTGVVSNIPTQPEAGKWGGDVWQTQMEFRDLELRGKEATEATGEGGAESGGEGEAEASARARLEEELGLTRQILAESQKAAAVAAAQAPVLSSYLGAYKTGGTLPADGYYEGHKGETVIPADAGALVHNHIHINGDRLADYLDVVVEQRLSQMARTVGLGRGTPSAPGRRAVMTQGGRQL